MNTEGTCYSVSIMLVSVLSGVFLEKIIKITRLYQSFQCWDKGNFQYYMQVSVVSMEQAFTVVYSYNVTHLSSAYIIVGLLFFISYQGLRC